MPRGFTLIETLVVLLVIGVTLGVVGLSLHGADDLRQVDEVERLRMSLERVASRAQISGRPYAVELLPGGYRVARQNADGGWELAHDLDGARLQTSDMRWTGLSIQGVTQTAPLRIVFSTRVPRFDLRLAFNDDAFRLEGDRLGRVKVERMQSAGGAP